MEQIAETQPETAKELNILSKRKLGKARSLMLLEVMSSEEEDTTVESNIRGRPQRIVKRLRWENSKARKIKRRLDDFYNDHVATSRQCNVKATTVNADKYSEKMRNLDRVPDWAIKKQ